MATPNRPEKLKTVENAILFEGDVIKLLNVRASYPHLDKPYKGDDSDGKAAYSISALLPKETHREAAKLVSEAIATFAAREKFKVAKDRRCLKDGEGSGKDEQEECWIVSARETKAPTVRDRTGKKIEDKDSIPEIIYAGCRVDVIIRLWKQDNKFGKRVNANLISVAFRADDEPFGEGRVTDDNYWDEDDFDGGGDGADADSGWDDDEI